jgi:hypothetical protein
VHEVAFYVFNKLDDVVFDALLLDRSAYVRLEDEDVENRCFVLNFKKYLTIEAIPKSPYPELTTILIPKT